MAQEKKIVAEAGKDALPATPAPPPLPGKDNAPSAGFIPMPPRPAPAPPPLPAAAEKSAKTTAPADPPREPPRIMGARPQGSAESAPSPGTSSDESAQVRRAARRRAAGPVRGQLAANDDAPSIGGLLYALEQKPSNRPYIYAGAASVVWAVLAAIFLWATAPSDGLSGLAGFLSRPAAFLTLAGVVVPVAVLWFLALLAWRAEELRLRSSTMTEVAVRLAEPDRMAEQSVASLGQAVRRQVAFMNDAVSRALGRAGELEALVHNEVSALERSYEENERKIRGLIQELAGERQAILNTSGHVSETLHKLGSEIPTLIEKLSTQQVKLAGIIQGAGENLTALESAVGQSALKLETTLGMRTEELQQVLGGYANALGTALESRTGQMQALLTDHSSTLTSTLDNYTSALAEALGSRNEQLTTTLATRSEELKAAFGEYMQRLDSSLESRTANLQTVFEEYALALDTSFANRAEAFDGQLVERTRALDAAFSERLKLFDDSIKKSALAIDSAVGDKALALTSALDSHAKNFSETIGRQTADIDESLMQGISAVRRTSENITRQSLKAIEGLAGQSDVLRSVSENLLGQIHQITNRFENQSQGIMRSANSLEAVNFKIDQTLQARHGELTSTLDRLSGKADEFGRFIEGYSTTIATQLTEAETRARAVAHEIILGAEKTKRAAIADLDKFRTEADNQGVRALDELRQRFASVSSAVSDELDTLSSRFDVTTEEVRQRSQKAAKEIAAEQAWLREQMDRLPETTRESTDVMRRALQDQLKALEQLSSLTTRTAGTRDVAPPLALPPSPPVARRAEPVPPDRPFAAPERLAAPEPRAHAPQGLPAVAPALPPPRDAFPPPAARASLSDAPPRTSAPESPIAGHAPPTASPRSRLGAGSEAWSLGDLLARASRDDDHHGHTTGAATPPAAAHAPAAALPATVAQAPAMPEEVRPSGTYQLNVDVIARALDPATTTAIWSRMRAGQRGIMVRSIYSVEGRALFDEVSRRLKADADLMRTVNRYLADFERIQREAEAKDPSGRLVQNHLVSDTGRVYLFLAHASGRLS